MIWFVLASLAPVVLLLLALFSWGGWGFAALLYISVFVYALDRLGRSRAAVPSAPASPDLADALSVALALGHFALLAALIARLPDLPLAHAIATGLGLGLFMGQVTHPNAHELIHHRNRTLRRLGTALYTSMLIGHHVSAHLRVHHVHVSTAADPNSARQGQSFFAFLPRAWVGSFIEGARAETALRQRATQRRQGLHPYVNYVAGGAALLALAFAWSGGPGLIALLCVCAYAEIQIFLADYLQHYGLRRARLPSGRPEPVGPQHSWNSPHWYSSALMLNAPRHSDHHVNPDRRFPDLHLTDQMPRLPYSVPVMAVLALCPPIWRRVMDRRVAKWMAGKTETA